MSVQIDPDGGVALVGDCPSGDAETLLRHLSATPNATVDWRACTGAHTAVVQVLLAAGVTPVGPPINPFLANVVASLLKRR